MQSKLNQITNGETLLAPIQAFLKCETPAAWITIAAKPESLPVLLVDHLICELKAAQTAAWLLRKYALTPESGKQIQAWLQPYEDFVYRHQGEMSDFQAHKISKQPLIARSDCAYSKALIDKMVLLIKEELHHFYQVLEFLEPHQIEARSIPAGRYAKELMRQVRTFEPATLVDKLICGAYIEARSCERFAKLAPYLAPELTQFYRSLLRSEARHYEDYLELAQMISADSIAPRVEQIGAAEAALILAPDDEFRFHSGSPQID